MKTLVSTLAALCVAANAMAQPLRLAPPDAIADRLVAEALGQAPEVAAAQAAVEAAGRRVVPARTLPDPKGSLTFQNDGRSPSLGTSEGSFIGLMVSQPLPWPGKLALSARVAESEAREVAAVVPRAQRAIEARVRNAWYDLLLAHAIERILDDRNVTATQIEATTRERYAAGLAVQQDVLRAQIELARIGELEASQRAVVVAKTAELNRLTGRAQSSPVDAAGTLPVPLPVPAAAQVIDAVAAQSPEIASAQQAMETRRIAVDLARKSFLPDFVVSAGSMYRGSFEMGPMWQVGVGISIPAWIDRRQRNQLAEAQAMAAVRSANADVVRQQLELRTRERLAQIEASDEVAALYRDRILPLDELSLESALASYTSGKVPFVTVLDAVNALYGDRAAYQGRLAEGARWRVAVDEASLEATATSLSPSVGSAPMGGGSRDAATASTANAMTSMR